MSQPLAGCTLATSGLVQRTPGAACLPSPLVLDVRPSPPPRRPRRRHPSSVAGYYEVYYEATARLLRGYHEATTRLLRRGYYEATMWLLRGYYEVLLRGYYEATTRLLPGYYQATKY